MIWRFLNKILCVMPNNFVVYGIEVWYNNSANAESKAADAALPR